MSSTSVRLAYLTAGAAGMYCGSCLRDNSLVTALNRRGGDATLVPTYTPIRTDEPDESIDQVFLGGLNVYLQQRLPLMRYLPGIFDRWLDHPWLIRQVAKDGAPPDPRFLGQLTLSMLRGSGGNQRKEVRRLTTWLQQDLRPNVINLSNMLIAGCVPTLRREIGVPIVVTLQGDDVFLEGLPPEFRRQAIDQIRRLVADVDAFIAFNRFYADFMSDYFDIPPEKIHVVQLGIQLNDYRQFDARGATMGRPPTIGYLARLAPEKGLHTLIDAFVDLRQNRNLRDIRLRIAGWLGQPHTDYAEQQLRRLDEAGLAGAYDYMGAVDRAQKLEFLSSIDVLSVPTDFQDPKGIYVLESLAAGVPCVQPDHGAFPELLGSTRGGVLVPPRSAPHLADAIADLLENPDRAREVGRVGRARVFERHGAEHMADATLKLYKSLIAGRKTTASAVDSSNDR